MKLIDILVQELPKRGGWPDCSIQKSVEYLVMNHNVEYGVDTKCKSYFESDTEIVTKEQYEAALAAKNDGWIDWAGGECPVDTKTLVDIKLKDGSTYKSCHPGDYSWRHGGYNGDIIAYRLHKPQVVTESDDEADLNECIGQDVAQVWNGEGLPPVGCECEMQDGAGCWIDVDIIANKDGFTFGWSYDYRMVYFSDKENEFRATRSEADKKREEVIMSLAGAVCSAHFTYGEKLSDGQLLGSMWYELCDAIAAGKVRGVKLED
nr:MAG: hypothetical protein [Bacteriophage sp.]